MQHILHLHIDQPLFFLVLIMPPRFLLLPTLLPVLLSPTHITGALNIDRAAVIAKTKFTMVSDQVKERLAQHEGLESVVLFGIEVGR